MPLSEMFGTFALSVGAAVSFILTFLLWGDKIKSEPNQNFYRSKCEPNFLISRTV